MADTARCYGCNKMFEPYTNEWFCSDTCEADYPHDKWPRAKFSREDHTAWDDYWWEQRLSDASFHQGQKDAKVGLEPRSVHPSYIQGYNDPEGTGGGTSEAADEPAEAAKRKTPLVVVRSWLQR